MALVLQEGKGIQQEKIFLLRPVDRLGGLVVITPARRARDPGSIPGFNNELRKMMRNKIPIYFQSDPHKYQHMLVGL